MRAETKSKAREKQKQVKQEDKSLRTINSEKKKKKQIKWSSAQLKKSWSRIIIIKHDSSEDKINKVRERMKSFLKSTEVSRST